MGFACPGSSGSSLFDALGKYGAHTAQFTSWAVSGSSLIISSVFSGLPV